MSDAEQHPFSYNVFKLAFTEPGAITYFSNHLPVKAVGFSEGQTGIGEFYVALLDFYDTTKLDPIDPIAFQSWLEQETDIYSALGGMAGVKTMIDLVMTVEAPNFESTSAILKHRLNKRKQMDSLQELQLLISKKEHKTDEDHQRINYLTEEIRALEREIGYNPLENVLSGEQIAIKGEQLWDLPDFMPTQFLDLNKALGYTEDGGFCKGAVHAILAASGRGKSSFAKSLMNHWVDNGYTVLYVNYEEAVAHWERVLFTQVTGQNVYKAKELTTKEKLKFTKVFNDRMKEWGDRFMVRHDPDTPYFEDLEKWLYDVQGHNSRMPDAIIIDTIQSMFLKGGGSKAQRWGQYEEMMVRLEKLAKDTGAAVIITAQENTNRMKERREIVEQSDIGGSISIAQKSSVTIFITEKKLVSGDDAEDERLMQLQIPKNRITGTTFTMEPLLVKYDDDTKSYLPYDMAEDVYNPGMGMILEDLYKDGDAI